MKSLHVIFIKDESLWTIKLNDRDRSADRFKTQKEAIDVAIPIAKNLKVELIVHEKDGSIGWRNSYGNDPYPPRG